MYYSYNYKTDDLREFAAVFFGLIAFVLIVSLIIAVITIIAQWKIFEKAGKAGWKAIIPFYNMYTLTEISGYSGWFFLLSFIPGVGALVWVILVSINLSKYFGKSSGFAVGLVLLSPVFQMILAFDKSEYRPNGVGTTTSDTSTDSNTNTQRAPKAKKTEDPWIEGE